MPAIPAAIIGGSALASALIGHYSSKKAASTQADAAKYAADLQAQTAQQALDLQSAVFQYQSQLQTPYASAGGGALKKLSNLLGITPTAIPAFGKLPSASATTPGSNSANTLNFGSMMDFNQFKNLITGGGSDTGGGKLIPPETGTVNRSAPPQQPKPVMDDREIKALYDALAPLGPDAFPAGMTLEQFIAKLPGVSAATAKDLFDNVYTPGTQQQGQIGDASGLQFTPDEHFGDLLKPFPGKFDFNGANFTQDPSYQWRLKQGMKALQGSAAAKGSALGGGTLKALNDYAGGSASQEYGAAYNRAATDYDRAFNTFSQNQGNLYNRLAALAGVGQTAIGNINSAGANYGQQGSNILTQSGMNQGNLITQAANASASGYIGAGNAIGQGINSFGQNALDLWSLSKYGVPFQGKG